MTPSVGVFFSDYTEFNTSCAMWMVLREQWKFPKISHTAHSRLNPNAHINTCCKSPTTRGTRKEEGHKLQLDHHTAAPHMFPPKSAFPADPTPVFSDPMLLGDDDMEKSGWFSADSKVDYPKFYAWPQFNPISYQQCKQFLNWIGRYKTNVCKIIKTRTNVSI